MDEQAGESIPPPTSRDLDQFQYHISLEEIGKKLQRAADLAFPNAVQFRYSAVYVLLIYWEDEDPRLPVSIETEDLCDVLTSIYNYDVAIWRIPSEGSHKRLNRRILDFIELDGDSKDDLKIVYYGGHGMLADNRQSSWTSRPDPKDPRYQIVKWNGIQHALEEAESDVLLLFDSCASGTANTNVGRGVTELIAACGFNTSANPVGPHSFTRALITELVLLKDSPCFTVGALYNKILCRVQNWMPLGREMQKPPLHVVLTQNRRLPQSIQLSRKRLATEISASDQGLILSPSVLDDGEALHKLQNSSNPSLKRHRDSDDDSTAQARKRQQTQSSSHPPNSTPSSQDSLEIVLSDNSSPISSTSSPPSDIQTYPRISLTIRLKETLTLSEFNEDLFAEWMKMVPILADHVKVEAGFISFSTLLILSLSVQLWCYLPHHPAISVIGLIKSPNLLSASSAVEPECPKLSALSNSEKIPATGSCPSDPLGDDYTVIAEKLGVCDVPTDKGANERASGQGEATPLLSSEQSNSLNSPVGVDLTAFNTHDRAYAEAETKEEIDSSWSSLLKNEADLPHCLTERTKQQSQKIAVSDIKRGLDSIVSRFRERLVPKDEEAFAFTTLGDLLLTVKDIQDRQVRNKTTQNLTRIQPFLQAMVQFGQVLEVFVNSSSYSYIWGPMKCLLLIASTWSDAFDILLDAYKQLGECCPLLLEYTSTFANDSHSLKILEMIYEDVLDFHFFAWRVFTQPAWKQIFKAAWKSLQDRFSSITNNLLQVRELLVSQASLGQIRDAYNVRLQSHLSFAAIEEQQNHAKMLEVLNWLSAADQNLDQEAFCHTRHGSPDTGSWILREPKIKKWLDPDDVSVPVFWLSGIPGAGKTILASVIVEQMMKALKPNDTSVIFFYCRDGDAERNTFTSVAKSMLAQLLKQNTNCLAYLYDCVIGAAQLVLKSQKESAEILGTLLRATPHTFVVIDGLDECQPQERKYILDFFMSTMNEFESAAGKLRTLFVSQELPDIRKVLRGAERLRLNENHVKADIHSYTIKYSSRIQERFAMPDEARESMAELVCARADGMFLFAKLILENLYGQMTLDQVYNELSPEIFPHGLGQAYARIVKRVFADAGPGQQQTARQLLGWITYAKRALKWPEIQGMLSIDLVQRTVNFEERQMHGDIGDICGSLVDVMPGNRIHLVHKTAGQYLTNNKFIDEREVETSLALLCMQYLTFECFEDGISGASMIEFVKRGYYAFLEYSSLYWNYHLESAVRHASLQDLHHLPELGGTINEFFEMYDPGPMNVGDTHKEWLRSLAGIEKAEFYEPLLLLLSHEKASRIATEQLDALGVLGVTISKVRAILEDIGMSTDVDTLTLHRLGTFYGDKWYKCTWHACYLFHEGFEKRQDLMHHINRHERPFCCTEIGCTRMYIGFSSQKELKKHQNTYHHDPNTLSRSFPNVQKCQTRFECQSCHKTFTRAFNLKIHHEREHTTHRPYICKSCGKVFSRKYDCERHESIHTK